MKKLILLVLVTVMVTGAGVLSVRHYQNYQTKQDSETRAAVDAQDLKISELEKTVKSYQANAESKIESLTTECEKGVAAYEKLSSFTQQTTPRPNCATAQRTAN